MTGEEAKWILMRWRPGKTAGEDDPEMVAALQRVEADPTLRDWFQRHRELQELLCGTFQSLPVPTDLESLLVQRNPAALPPPSPSSGWSAFGPAGWKLAAGIVIFLLGAILWNLLDPGPDEPPGFETYRSRMVRTVLREYRMDLETNNLAEIRGFLRQSDAPADFRLNPSLTSLTPVGGGLLSWQGHPVSMVCLDGNELGMLYLFIVPTDAIGGGAPQAPRVEQINRLGTVSWSEDNHTYLLAAVAPPEDLRPFAVE